MSTWSFAPISVTVTASQAERSFFLLEIAQLKDQSVAPALQGKMTELERSQLELKLQKEFASRPDPQSLMAKGILKEGDI